MKELKPKVVNIRAKRSRLQHNLPVPELEQIRGVTTAIKPLQLQLASEKLLQPRQIRWQQQRLTAQAERINQLSSELEEAMLELKAIANDINGTRRIGQNSQKPVKSACKYLVAIVPCVTRRKAGGFVLATRTVDLFQAEREAEQVAKRLRHQAQKRQVLSPQNHTILDFRFWLGDFKSFVTQGWKKFKCSSNKTQWNKHAILR